MPIFPGFSGSSRMKQRDSDQSFGPRAWVIFVEKFYDMTFYYLPPAISTRNAPDFVFV